MVLSVDCVLLLVAVLLGSYHAAVEGGCAGKCCRGSDNSCATTDWRVDRVYGTCYCDEGCARTLDCCHDYPTACPAQACVVTEWSHWSGCAQSCQPSKRVRQRHIEREPRNTGETCPNLEELAGCMEYRSHQTEHCAQNTGPAFITTLVFGSGRKRYDVYGSPLDPGFCMEYRMESLTSWCEVENRPHTRWMQYLREGHSVCVACQPPAMRNHSTSCQGDGQESNRLWGTLVAGEHGGRSEGQHTAPVLKSTASSSSDNSREPTWGLVQCTTDETHIYKAEQGCLSRTKYKNQYSPGLKCT